MASKESRSVWTLTTAALGLNLPGLLKTYLGVLSIRMSVGSGLRGQKRALGSLDLESRDSCLLPCGTGT